MLGGCVYAGFVRVVAGEAFWRGAAARLWQIFGVAMPVRRAGSPALRQAGTPAATGLRPRAPAPFCSKHVVASIMGQVWHMPGKHVCK